MPSNAPSLPSEDGQRLALALGSFLGLGSEFDWQPERHLWGHLVSGQRWPASASVNNLASIEVITSLGLVSQLVGQFVGYHPAALCGWIVVGHESRPFS